MNIAFIADIRRRHLIETFCTAYKPILRRHTLYATQTTGTWIENASGLRIEKMHDVEVGGAEQLRQMIECGKMNMVIFFFDSESGSSVRIKIEECLRSCDRYQIPLALNMASAEMLVLGLAGEEA